MKAERKALLKKAKKYSSEWNVNMLTQAMIESIFIDGYKYANEMSETLKPKIK